MNIVEDISRGLLGASDTPEVNLSLSTPLMLSYTKFISSNALTATLTISDTITNSTTSRTTFTTIATTVASLLLASLQMLHLYLELN